MVICWLQKESLPTWYVYVWEPRERTKRIITHLFDKRNVGLAA